MRRALYITTLWPEPRSSAAGVRSMSLTRILNTAFDEVHIASAGRNLQHRAELERAGPWRLHDIALNCSSFDTLCASIRPSLVLFDRFVVEEQFGWRVRRAVPEAARVLDTQDLHFIRRARARLVAAGAGEEEVWALPERLAAVGPGGEPEGDVARELAAIHRSDAALVCSELERDLLARRMAVGPAKLHVAPFFYPEPGPVPPLPRRRHFVAIGNFRHAPNADAVEVLARRVWPAIRARLPAAELHVYGAYPGAGHVRLSDEGGGLHVRGPCPDAVQTLARYRLQLAPLRFGAGIKGKVADSWAAGTPVVTTPIGSEGMLPGAPLGPGHHAAALASASFGGLVRPCLQPAFAEAAVALYEDDGRWEAAAAAGRRILAASLSEAVCAPHLVAVLRALAEPGAAAATRAGDFAGAALWYHAARSTEYMGRWIEAKARAPPATPPPPAPGQPPP